MSIAHDWTVATGRLSTFVSDGMDAAREPLGRQHLWPVLYLLGILLDTVTTCSVGIVPGVVEGNPFALAGMNAFGGPAVYMALGLILLSPGAILLAARPRTLVPTGLWFTLAAVALVKLAIGLSNIVVITGSLRGGA